MTLHGWTFVYDLGDKNDPTVTVHFIFIPLLL